MKNILFAILFSLISISVHARDNPCSNKEMNPDVQLQDNGWIRIVEQKSSTEVLELLDNDKEIVPVVRVTIQFLKPCEATPLKYEQHSLDNYYEDFLRRNESFVPRFRCNYRMRLFVTYFTKEGNEYMTDSRYPNASRNKTEILPGEKTDIIFIIPLSNDQHIENWCAWVPK